jgi:hypothetical protein
VKETDNKQERVEKKIEGRKKKKKQQPRINL